MAGLKGLVVVAAVVAVALAGDSGRGLVSAQVAGISGAADCGSGNPLHGRTQGVVNVIVAELQEAGTLTASQTCSDVTDVADLADVTGIFSLLRDGLTQVRARDFAGLSGVTRLDLRFNSLTELPVDAFVGLTAMSQLFLHDNKLSTIRSGAFNGLGALRILYLHNNEISTLPSDVFSVSSLNALETINLPGNEIRNLPATLFQGLPALDTINVEDNFLTSDRLGWLATPISTLERLYLGENLLTSGGSGPDPDLPTNIFGVHPNLTSLYLSDNRIVELPSGVFSGMSGVVTIRVQNNRLTRLQSGVFDGVTWSTSAWSGSIWFTGNLLTTVDESVFNGGPCGPRPSPMPTDPTNCIAYIYLDYNLIESVPAGLFSGLTELRNIYLRGNRLTTLPAGLFTGISRITFLSLNQNLLETLPAGLFSSFQSLSTLNLNDNKLMSLPANVFDGLPKFTSGANLGLLQRPRSLYIGDNPMPESEVNAVKALFPTTATVVSTTAPTTTREVPTLGGTREVTANCGPGHTLTGRTREVVWRIMLAAYSSPSAWSALPVTASSWGSLSAWQSSHGTTPGPGDPPAIDPAHCDVVTAGDLLRVQSMTIYGRLVSLESGDFAGLSNLQYLDFRGPWNVSNEIRELPSGIFNGLTSLNSLRLYNAGLLSLSTGVFDGLINLRELQLDYNFLTGLPAGVFDDLTDLRVLDLQQNRLSSLPPGVFRNLRELRTLRLYLNDLDAEDLPVGTFNGLSNLRSLTLWENNFRTLFLEVFTNQGLSHLKTLRIGQQNEDRTTPEEFAAFQRSLPSLTRLDRLTGAPVLAATPTPTPTATATPTFHERIELPIVSKVVPQVRSLTVTAGDEVRLSFALYNVQDALDNDLYTHDSMAIVWTDSGGGTFSESRGTGADRDGEIDDREVMWRAPSLPGRHTVTASITPGWACDGSANECSAVFTVNVVRAASTSTPEPTPCPTAGTVPATVDDADGNTYSVITPAEGGEFNGEGVSVTVPRSALSGCGYIGLRAYTVLETGASARARYGNWTAGGMRYAVDAASSAGVKLANVVMRRPADVCVPLPDEFRATLSGLTLLRELGGGVQPLTSTVRRDATLGFRLCGAVSEFPVVVVAASRGDFGVTVAPSPTPEAAVPETGGGAPTLVYVMLAFALGVLVLTGIGRIWQDDAV